MKRGAKLLIHPSGLLTLHHRISFGHMLARNCQGLNLRFKLESLLPNYVPPSGRIPFKSLSTST